MEEYRIKKSSVNLHAIAESGQCFRMHEHTDGDKIWFDVFSADKFIQIFDEGDTYLLKCSVTDLKYWIYYFDLDADYDYYYAVIDASRDDFLKTAADYGRGMRILNQYYWEAIISFIISQNNNIPRIQKIIEALCERFGSEIEYEGKIVGYSFPSRREMKDVSMDQLQGLGLGYRDKYIWSACHAKDDELKPDLDTLLKLNGVGPKVANCILLYGFHHMYAYPVDTWVKRIEAEVYHGRFNKCAYRGFEGFIQQLMFYYYRHCNDSPTKSLSK